MNGFFNVYKPGGMTSHDVVAAVRRAARMQRVGHAGTLDPAAEGVLLVCVGPATRIVDRLMAARKRYRATIELGATTTTDDATGEVLERRDASGVSREAVEAAIAGMVGRVLQVPPMYSALKRGGTPLYRLARKGIEIEREPREIEIYSLTLVDCVLPRFTVDVECGKGTYVRTIAHDLGERVGCGAHLAHLVRTASGRFTADGAVLLADLLAALGEGQWADLLYPADEALLDLPAVAVGEENERRVETGSPWRPTASRHEPEPGALVRIYSSAGELLGLAEYDAARGHYQPRKSLRVPRAGEAEADAAP